MAYSNLVSGFTKLFSTIIHSTVWREDMHVKVVWVTMLALANRNGCVFASVPGLADASKVSLDQCLDALGRLSSPDKWSRTKVNQGRRIREVDGGWELLNYLKYREKRDDDERRIQTRAAVARHRQKKKDDTLTVSHSKPRKAQAEAEAEAEAEKRKSAPRGHAQHSFCGQHFCISHRQHEFFSRELGAAASGFDLLGAYQRWDLRTDPIDNLLPWVKARIAEELPAVKKPSSTQAKQHVGQGPSPRDLELIAEWEREHGKRI